MIYFLLVLTVSAVVTYLLTPAVRTLALNRGIYTEIRARDIHTDIKPRWGGLAIYVGILAGIAVSYFIPLFSGIFADHAQILGLILGMTLIVITGMADDAWDIHWALKLAAQIGSAVILVIFGIQLEVMPVGWLGVGGPWAQALLTVFLVVLTINAFNFVDGLDGLAAGVAAIGGAAFFMYSYLLTLDLRDFEPSHLATLLMAVLVGSCLGFLPHNFHPSKLIMGDTGAMLLGFVMGTGALIATSSLGLHQEQFRFRNIPAYMPVLLPLAVMVLPVLDLVLAVIRRTLRGKSPFSPDRGHLHHKVLDSGYSHPQTVLLLYLWAGVVAFGFVSYNFLPWQLVTVAMAVTLGAATILSLGPWLRRRAVRQRRRAARRAMEAKKARQSQAAEGPSPTPERGERPS